MGSKKKCLSIKKIKIIAFVMVILLSFFIAKVFKPSEKVNKTTLNTNSNVHLNPLYAKYVKDFNDGDISSWNIIPKKYIVETENNKTNPMLSLYNHNYFNGLGENGTLPATYNLLDLSCGIDTDGNVIPCSGKVKNQGKEGLCWTYAINSSIETNLLIKNKDIVELQGINYLASQKQLDYALANPLTAIIENTNPYWDYMQEYSGGYYNRSLNSGGNFDMARIALNGGFSPVEESLFFNLVKERDTSYNWEDLTEIPTNDEYKKSQSIKDVINYDNVDYTVMEYYNYPFLNYYGMDQYPNDKIVDTRKQERINILKENIQKYGSVFVSTLPPDSRSGTCYDSNSNTVIKKGSNSCGVSVTDIVHAMSLIGWDDNYSYTDPANNKVGTGAWIVKNSWGDSNPYSYLAYTSAYEEVATIKTVEEKKWNKLYDMISVRDRIKVDSKTETYKYYKGTNVEKIEHIAFQNTESQNLTYTFYLSKDNGKNYELLGEINAPLPGKYELELDNQITLNNDFIIKIVYDKNSDDILRRNMQNDDELYVYTSEINLNDMYIETEFDNTIYINLDNEYDFASYFGKLITPTGYRIENIEGTDVTDGFNIVSHNNIKNNTTATLSFKNLSDYSNYVGKNYKLITTGTYVDGEETKTITYENTFDIEIQKVEQIQISTTDLTIYKGYDKKIDVEVFPQNALIKDLIYEINNSNILKNEDNTLTALEIGTTIITINSTDGSNVSEILNVTTKEGLNLISSLSDITDLKGGYRLLSDITINSGFANDFEGTFDGNGHTIYLNNNNSSVFNKIKNACITKLNVTESDNINNTQEVLSDSFGVLARTATNSIITNVGNSVNLDFSDSENNYLGGLIGELNNSILENAYNDGIIKSDSFVGGLVGKATNSKIKNVFNSGNLLHKIGESNVYRGGIVSVGDNVSITNSYNVGNFSYSYFYQKLESGSIIGSGINNSKIENTYSPYFLGDTVINNDMEKPAIINSQKYDLEEMKEQNKYQGFDFINIWTLDNNEISFPTLQGIEFITGSKENTTEFNGGTGKLWNPYRISSLEQMNNVKKISINGLSFILENDIDMPNDTYWNSYKFVGTFNGNNNKIIGMKSNYGLFSELNNSYIYNLGMEDSLINPDSYLIGVIADKATDSIIKNCYNTSDVVLNDAHSVGGIVGIANYNVKIYDSYNTGNITILGDVYYIGGIIGQGENNIEVYNSYNTGDITSDSHEILYIGGIIGKSGNNTKLYNLYNTGNFISPASLTSSTKYHGGIAGKVNKNALIYSCYNAGNITSSVNNLWNTTAGGIIAYSNINVNINNCYNSGNISGYTNNGGISGGADASEPQNGGIIANSYNIGNITTSKGVYFSKYNNGIGNSYSYKINNSYTLKNAVKKSDGTILDGDYEKTLEEMKQQSTYVGFDFKDTWEMKNLGVFPTLKSNSYTYATNINALNDTINLQKYRENDVSNYYTIYPLDASNKNVKITSNNDGIVINDNNQISVKNETGLGTYNEALTIETVDGTRLVKTINANVNNDENFILIKDFSLPTIYDYIGGEITATVKLNNLDNENVEYEITKNGEENTINLKNYFTITESLVETIDTLKKFDISITIPANSENITAGTYSLKIIGENNTESNIMTFDISEYIHVKNISLNKNSITLKKLSSETLSVIFSPVNSMNKNVNWISSDSNIATVDQNGKVTAVARGTATITATAEDQNKTATCTVTVVDPKLTFGSQITTGNNEYNTSKIYEGYGGTITQTITKQDIYGDLDYYIVDADWEEINKRMRNSGTWIYNYMLNLTDTQIELTIPETSTMQTGDYEVILFTQDDEYIFEFTIHDCPIVKKEGTEYRFKTLDNKKYLENIIIGKTGITKSDFLEKFDITGTTKILNGSNIISDNAAKIGTGMKLKIGNDEEVTIIVNGDVNGNGNIDIFDYIKIMNHIMKPEKELLGIYYEAADITQNNKVDIFDYIRIMNMLK